jgi:hypothetical protein
MNAIVVEHKRCVLCRDAANTCLPAVNTTELSRVCLGSEPVIKFVLMMLLGDAHSAVFDDG